MTEKMEQVVLGETKYTIQFTNIKTRENEWQEFRYITLASIFVNDQKVVDTSFSTDNPGDIDVLLRNLTRLYRIYYTVEFDETREKIKKEMLLILAKLLYILG